MIYRICDAKHGFIQNADVLIYNNVGMTTILEECAEKVKKLR